MLCAHTMMLTRVTTLCAAARVARATATRPTVVAAAPLRARVGRRGVAVGLRAGSHVRSVSRRRVVVAASADAASPTTPKRTDRVHWSTAFVTGVAIAAAASPLVRPPCHPRLRAPSPPGALPRANFARRRRFRPPTPLRGCRTLMLATRTLRSQCISAGECMRLCLQSMVNLPTHA